MTTSSTAISGLYSRIRRTAFSPSPASAITRPPLSHSMTLRKPSRKIGWSSAMIIAGLVFMVHRIDGESDVEFGAEIRRGLEVEFSTQNLHALAHIGQAEATFVWTWTISRARREAVTVV